MISKRSLHSELNFSRKEAVGRRNSPAVVEESVDSHYLRKDTSPNIFNEVVRRSAEGAVSHKARGLHQEGLYQEGLHQEGLHQEGHGVHRPK